MKTCITIILLAFVITSGIAQEKNIETKSIELDNLISFVIQNYNVSNEDKEFVKRNLTFLIQVPDVELDIESQVILKQVFKILSKRLSVDDYISIIAYSGFNGIALYQTEPQQLKKILYTINNLKSSVKELHVDGIELGYNYAEDNFEEDAVNTVILVRNPNRLTNVNSNMVSTTMTKKKNGAVLITALSLLPEIIAVIKN